MPGPELVTVGSTYRTLGPSQPLAPLQSEGGGAFRIPINGRSALVSVQVRGSAATSAAIVLFGVTGAMRVPLAVCFVDGNISGTGADSGGGIDGGAWPAFIASGLPFESLEVHAGGPADLSVRAIGSVSPFGGGPPSLRTIRALSRYAAGSAVADYIPAVLRYRPLWDDALDPLDKTPTTFRLVTPSDTVNMNPPPDYGILLSADGVIKVTDTDFQTPTLTLVGGVVHRITPLRIWATPAYVGTIHAVYRTQTTAQLFTV